MSAKKTAKIDESMPAQEGAQSVQPQQVPAQPQQAPMQPQAYDPNMYYQKPIDPNKGKAKWLTFEYLAAMLSTVFAASLLVRVIVSVFGLWFSQTTSVATTTVGGWVSGVLSLDTVTPGTGLVVASIMAILLSVVAFVCFKRVSRAIPDRKDYTSSLEYKLITYGGFALLALPILVLTAKIIGVLVNSLLFIGVYGAGVVYKSLYLAEFLPYLLALGVLVYAAMCLKDIINGKNVSNILSIVLIAVASVVLFTSAITVAVKIHDSSNNYRSTTTELRDTMRNFELDY